MAIIARVNTLVGTAAALFVILAIVRVADAATITVNSLADPGASGICALRDAITAANTETAVNGCAAGSGNDTIVFSVTGTITLSGELPPIVNTLTIQGPTANPPEIAVDGASQYQVMVVNSGATLNFNDVTIAHADGVIGGGIDNEGTLTVSNSTFAGNSADVGGGIYNNSDRTLTVTNCSFSGNFGFGGGIDNGGTLTVTNSTFSGNNGYEGGGIINGGALTVTNSTFSDNGAVSGGGILNLDGTSIVTNSTFSDNSAASGGGIANIFGSTLTVTNSTFSGNGSFGGGIYNQDATIDIKGAILAASTGGNCFEDGGTFTDEGFNLDDDGSCDFSSGTTSDADIALDPTGLQDNGGPTETIALEPGSVAANAIPVASCQYVNVNPCTNPPTTSASGPLVCDQRGEPRPGSGESACAIGAFEPQILTEFAEFQTGLIVFPNQFAAGGSFELAADAPTFNPPAQAVTMTLSSAAFGPLAVTIAAGSFTLNTKDQYKYSGTIAGINYGVTISAPVDGVYEFTFAAFGVDVTGITNPVSVTLQIGSNIGTDDNVAAAIL